MKNSIKLLGAVASLALFGAASSASATTFLFSFTGNGGKSGVNGTLQATKLGTGGYNATSGTAMAFGPVVTGSASLIPNPAAPATSTSGTFTYDDLLFPNAMSLISTNGLLFQLANSTFDISSDGGTAGTYKLTNSAGTQISGNFALSQVAAVPEASTWAMMLGGFAMIGIAARRRSLVKTTVRYA